MNDKDIDIAVKIFVNVLLGLKSHCNESECKNCKFVSTFNVCILERKPHQYNIEQIKTAVNETLIQEL